MAYTAQSLITKALYLSGVCSRELQTPTGSQISWGLELLNDILAYKSIETDLVPYWQNIEFDCVADQETYYLPYISTIQSCTFNLGVVRYAMSEISSRKYFGSARVESISTLPYNWNQNRVLQGTNLSLYFKPDSNYTVKCMVKLFLVDVSLTTDLTNITESFINTDNNPNYTQYSFINSSNQGFDYAYIEYLRLKLAQYICSEMGIALNPTTNVLLKAAERKLMYVSPPDLSIMSQNVLSSNRSGSLSWDQVNLGRGYSPL